MEVGITIKSLKLGGILEIPREASSIVIFAHSFGGANTTEGNVYLASELHKVGLGTLLLNLLTEKEAENEKNKIDVELLTERLIAVTKWCVENEKTKKLSIGYLGSGVGAAASLSAAAYWGTKIKAVVSRGGRPDLAYEVLDLIESPTLLIVGQEDKRLIDANRVAYQKLGCVKKTEVVVGANHFFEEDGSLKKVADLAGAWFLKYA